MIEPASDLDRATAIDDGASQRIVSNPAVSAWVSANAGTGKTYLMADRVLRLLLAGTRPSAILGLTFTKAAAAEMADRVYRRLGRWATGDEKFLAKELSRLLERPPEPAELARARRLFAHTLDAHGGLRLQTIHAFCEAVLKRFPLEAGVAPYFQVADDRVAGELIEDAMNDVLAQAADAPNGPLGRALAVLVVRADEDRLQDILAEIVRSRSRFADLLARYGASAPAALALRGALGIAAGDTPENLKAAYIAGVDLDALQSVAVAMRAGSATDQMVAEQMTRWLRESDKAQSFDEFWRPVFFVKAGDPRKKLMTRGLAKQFSALADLLQKEQEKVLALNDRIKAARSAELSEATLALAEFLIEAYARKKANRAMLDFNDLILTTQALLRRPGVLNWVLFKLDQGIDHILIDEAQDTSPEQWSVIAAIADEFFSGAGAREVERTVFAVGDEKQSIYSFQGADPKAFATWREHFKRRAEAAARDFHERPLNWNRRSVEAVLSVVDRVFAADAARQGVSATAVKHRPVRAGEGGLVELWPPVPPGEFDAGQPWDAPLDYQSANHPVAILASRIADTIEGWLRSGEILQSQGRPIEAGDIMILVTKRGRFFETMVRTLRQRNLPVAGADRLVLAQHIAVQDLLAAARFALLPEDDLTLACLLKSPLCGFDDDQLFELCHGREPGAPLWRVLRTRAGERQAWAATVAELSTLMAQADFMPPFEFYATLLGAGGGRTRLLARLGPEAADPLDEFLNAALAYERQHTPSLQGFLHWFAASSAAIKRDLEKPGGLIRVMTAHGAKGLQSNIVFLPETCKLPDGRTDPKFFWLETAAKKPQPLVAAAFSAKEDAALVADARRQARSLAREEYRRLLYVAMTRAADRLYVCGWLEKSKGSSDAEAAPAEAPAGSWYDLIANAMQDPPVAEIDLPWKERGRRWLGPQKGEKKIPAPAAASPTRPALAPWLPTPAPAEALPSRPLAPSRLESDTLGVKSPLGASRESALRRGTLLHRLLEVLPDLDAQRRGTVGATWLKALAPDLAPAARADLLAKATGLLADPEFSELFGAQAIAEAPLSGRIGSLVIAGRVDRLLVAQDRVLVVDFKSNRQPPGTADEVETAIVRQMAAYWALLQQIFPGREIRAGVLWTEAPALMWLDRHLLERFATQVG